MNTPEQRAAERLHHQYSDEWLKDAIKPPNHPSRYEEYKEWNSFSNKQRSEIASIIAAEFEDERKAAKELVEVIKCMMPEIEVIFDESSIEDNSTRHLQLASILLKAQSALSKTRRGE